MSEEEPTIGEVAPLMSGIHEGRLGIPRKSWPDADSDLTGPGLWGRAAKHLGLTLDEYMTTTMDFSALQTIGEFREINRRLAHLAGIDIAEVTAAMDTDDMLTEREDDGIC